MGKNNSSEIRVAPFGEMIVGNHQLVNQLLHLVGCTRVNFGSFDNNDVFFSGNVDNKKIRREKSLQPTNEHLKAIIELLYTNNAAMEYFKKAVEESKVTENVKKNRESIAKGSIVKENVWAAIDNKEAWAIFEGASKPDLFIESDKYILIVEGKLTEPKTTTSTTYLESRNQMLRHIQGALNYISTNNLDKKVIAFYIVPETFSQIEEIKDRNNFAEVINKESVRITNTKYIEEILSSYYGCTTWEKIEAKFNVKFRAVIDKDPNPKNSL